MSLVDVVVVAGPPCAGKSTYIEEHWKRGDIVIDYDDVLSVFTREPKHQPNEATRWIAFEAIEAAIRETIRRGYNRGTVWLPAGTRSRLMLLKRIPGSKVIMIDPGREVCEQRAGARSAPEGFIEGISAWYKDSTRVGY